MKEVFSWCDRCVFYGQCYKFEDDSIVDGPYFIEPKCGEGPATKDEIIPDQENR